MSIRRFIAAFRAFYKGYRLQVELDWTKEDAEILEKFMKTSTGAKLKQGLILQSYEQDRIATLDKNPTWACGCATGFRLAILKIDEFTVVPAESGDEYEALVGIPAHNRFDQNNR